ncbi:MAG: dipeptide epimerase [Clostridiales bacterium]|nr:dipeptide epimerase [Clostridiales bacterium]
MKIINYSIEIVNIPLLKPFITSLRRVDSVEGIILKIETDEGIFGLGSAAPTKVITGDTKESIIESIHIILKEIMNKDLNAYNEVFLSINHSLIGNTSGKAAVDMAIYDLLSKKQKMPLYQYLGGQKKNLQTDMTISMNEIDLMIKDSLDAYESGFRSLKIKLGDDINKDFQRMEGIFKKLGNHLNYRLDANQGWSPKDSVKIIKEFESMGINMTLVEQPVYYKDLEGMKFVTERVNTAILADESVFSLSEAVKIIDMRAADMINIKLMKTGGIYNAIGIARYAEEKKIDCMIGSMMESPISIHAAINFGMAFNQIKLFDLDVPSMYKKIDFNTEYSYGALIKPSNEVGLGISLK